MAHINNKTAKQRLAEICLYGNKEFVYSSDLQRMAEVVVQVDGEYQEQCMYAVPQGANIDFYTNALSGGEPIFINDFQYMASYEGHSIINSGTHIVSTMDISKELKELIDEDVKLARKNPDEWQARRSNYIEPTEIEMQQLIADHFSEPTIERKLAERCINNNKDPLILRDGSYVIVNKDSKKERTLALDELNAKYFKSGTDVDVVLPGEIESFNVGVVGHLMTSDDNIAIETNTFMDMHDFDSGKATGMIVSTIDFSKEYDKAMRDRYVDRGEIDAINQVIQSFDDEYEFDR